MSRFFSKQNVLIVEQCDSNKWNKGALFNIGVAESKNTFGIEFDYYIFHDVDFIPNKSVDYSYADCPTLLSTECSQFNYSYPYERFFGGVVLVPRKHFLAINGYSNQFKGWGGEDDMLMDSFSHRSKFIKTGKRLGNRFECFEHPRTKNNADYERNKQILAAGRDFSEGLSTIEGKYKETDSKVYFMHDSAHIILSVETFFD